MLTLDDTCDYIIVKTTEAGVKLSLLKLQKLVYYAHAWHLAFFKTRLFDGVFQAWVHGPVSRELYDRFNETKSLYDEVTEADIRPGFDAGHVPAEARLHIDSILEVYAPFSGTQLEELSHQELPWKRARGTLSPTQRCETAIRDEDMRSFYASLAK
jgi:uncharacterized phage-associated protein